MIIVAVSYVLKKLAEKSLADFFLAGRRLPTVVLIGTLMATFTSVVTVTSIPAKAATAGIVIAIFNSIGMYMVRFWVIFYGP